MDASTAATATVTIRFIRSFEHRNIKNIVLQNVPLNSITDDLKKMALEKLQSTKGIPPPFKKYPFDTFKIETQAYGFKTNDPVINRENDDTLILEDGVVLNTCGIKNETEISFFKRDDYLEYKRNPIVIW